MSEGRGTELERTLLAYALWAGEVDIGRLARLRGPLGPISAACFLLYWDAERDVSHVSGFLYHTAPILLQQFTRVTQSRRVVTHGRVQGKVDWSGTYKERYVQDVNPALYVCQQSQRHFDRPENQLFKYLLHGIRACLERASRPLATWQAWGSAVRGDRRAPLRLGDHFSSLAYRLRPLLAHVYLSGVTLPTTIDERHVLAARTSKNELYAVVADLYDLYHSQVERPTQELWSDRLGQVLPLPAGASEVGRLLASKG